MRRLLLAALLLISWIDVAFAANRFWVGGTATWDGTAGTKWATTSGGAGGAAVPTSSDAVTFDGNSGSGTVTLGTSRNALSLTMTNFTGTFAMGNGDVSVYGSVTFGSGMTLTGNGTTCSLYIQATGTLTTNGKTLSCNLNAYGGTTTLGDNATVTGNVTNLATFTTNNKNLTANAFLDGGTGSGSSTTFGTGTVTINGNFSAYYMSITDTFSMNSAGTIKLTNTSASTYTLELSPGTYGNLWITGSGSGGVSHRSTGTVNWNDFKVDTPPKTVEVTASRTIGVTTFTVAGSAGNLISFLSRSAGSQFTFSASSGTKICDYCSITDSDATGGATWRATHSTNGGNNTGWLFGSPGAAYQFWNFF